MAECMRIFKDLVKTFIIKVFSLLYVGYRIVYKVDPLGTHEAFIKRN